MVKGEPRCFWLALILALLPMPVFGQGNSRIVMKDQSYVSANAVRPGDKFKVAVALDVAKGYHINARTTLQKYLIQTDVQFVAPAGISVKETKYPQAELKTFGFAPDTQLAVYEGLVKIIGEAEADQTVQPGSAAITAKVTVQACNDEYCLAPAKFDVAIPLRIAAAGAAVEQVDAAFFSDLQQFQGSGTQDELGELIAAGGLPLALLTVFLAGLALNLTPCVYPIIPITIGFFMNQSASRGKARLSRTLLMAATYVFGMAITYSILGVAASMTGGLFGAALQNPLVLIGLAAVMVALSLSMFGVYEFRMPQFLNRFANQSAQSTTGLPSAFVMGLTMGIVAAPCIGPFVLGLLVHVSTKGDPIYGFFIFFVLALGLGMPYVLLGTFSGVLKELPRSGEWMIAVRKVFGLALLGLALYFLMPLMGTYQSVILAVFFAASALYLVLWEAGRVRPKAFSWILRAVGAGMAVAAVVMMLPEKEGIKWEPYSEAVLAAAQKEGRPVVIDAFADWCIPCKELDKLTFTDDAVKQEALRFLTLKLDLTTLDPDTEASRAKDRFQIKGVPTIVFIDANGREDQGLKLTGFEKPALFLQRMKRVQSLPAAALGQLR
jgi:thioredoxin:protein disulfide reductase